jgi:glycosyltransferase involved in cell wall biosynthesis
MQSTLEPKVTWLMCTNREDALLHRAIESCLSQTMTDYELLVVVNGPETDRLVRILSTTYANDQRVRVVGTPIHLLNFSLSLGLHLARARFVARMDADDVSDPKRLAMQLAYMQVNDDVAVLGSAYLLIDDHGHVHGKVAVPESDPDIRKALRCGNPICHPSVMLRRDAILAEGAYLGGRNAEDYDLWLRIAIGRRWRFANLGAPLLSYNVSPDGQARRSRAAYANVAGAQFRQFLMTNDIRWLMGAIVSAVKCFFLANRP